MILLGEGTNGSEHGYHLVRTLVTAAVRAFHCVAANDAELSPDHDARRRLFVLLNDKTTAAERERRRTLLQQLR